MQLHHLPGPISARRSPILEDTDQRPSGPGEPRRAAPVVQLMLTRGGADGPLRHGRTDVEQDALRKLAADRRGLRNAGVIGDQDLQGRGLFLARHHLQKTAQGIAPGHDGDDHTQRGDNRRGRGGWFGRRALARPGAGIGLHAGRLNDLAERPGTQSDARPPTSADGTTPFAGAVAMCTPMDWTTSRPMKAAPTTHVCMTAPPPVARNGWE